MKKIRLSFGLVFSTAVALMAGDALAIDPIPFHLQPSGSVGICTVSGATGTGREYAALVPTGRSNYARRVRLGGEAPESMKHCGQLGRELGYIVVD